jgi:predicted DNA-binding protein with PD1-like motif
MIKAKHINTSGSRIYFGTLTAGTTIHDALADMAKQHNIKAATFEMLGGLTEVEFAEYDFINKVRKPPFTWSRPLEIVNGHGTISLLENEPRVHLHLVLSFRDQVAPNGIAVIAGHCNRAVCFAVEFVLTAYDGEAVHRAYDEGTGLTLWKLD